VDPKCINCSEAHHTLSRECPKWKINEEINKIMALDNLSFMDARRLTMRNRNKEDMITKDLRNFPLLKKGEANARFVTYADIIGKSSSSSQLSMDSSVKIKELLKIIIAAPDSDLLLKRIFNTVALHSSIMQKELTSSGDINNPISNSNGSSS